MEHFDTVKAVLAAQKGPLRLKEAKLLLIQACQALEQERAYRRIMKSILIQVQELVGPK